MNTDPQAFEQLRRLLALKRHEQPPPGYFDRFPREVIAGIRAAESAAGLTALQSPLPWLERLWQALAARVVFPTTCSAAVCGVLVFGLMWSSGVQASLAPITERLPGAFEVADNHLRALPRAERVAPESSTAGVLPERPSAGLLHELGASGIPGAATLRSLSAPPAN